MNALLAVSTMFILGGNPAADFEKSLTGDFVWLGGLNSSGRDLNRDASLVFVKGGTDRKVSFMAVRVSDAVLGKGTEKREWSWQGDYSEPKALDGGVSIECKFTKYSYALDGQKLTDDKAEFKPITVTFFIKKKGDGELKKISVYFKYKDADGLAWWDEGETNERSKKSNVVEFDRYDSRQKKKAAAENDQLPKADAIKKTPAEVFFESKWEATAMKPGQAQIFALTFLPAPNPESAGIVSITSALVLDKLNDAPATRIVVGFAGPREFEEQEKELILRIKLEKSVFSRDDMPIKEIKTFKPGKIEVRVRLPAKGFTVNTDEVYISFISRDFENLHLWGEGKKNEMTFKKAK